MAPSTRRRKAAPRQEEAIPESIFDALNMNPPGGGSGGEPKGEAKAKGPTVEDLMKQIEDMNKRMEEQDRANLALTSAPPRVEVSSNLVEPKLNLDGLPDPIDDREGYAREIAKRTLEFNTAVSKYHAEKNKPVEDPIGKGVDLWGEFEKSHPDYAADTEGMEFVTQKVLKDAERRGLDVKRYMYQNTGRFFRDVTAAYDQRFGKPEEDEEPSPAPRKGRKVASQVTEPDDEDEGRTAGIFGGMEGTSNGRRPAAPPAGDLVKDLQDIQRKTGYF